MAMLRAVLGVAKRGGIKNIRNFLLGFNGQRISPLTMIATLAYIETQISEEKLLVNPEIHAYDRSRNLVQLGVLVATSIPSFVKPERRNDPESKKKADSINKLNSNKAHGAAYHILQIAFKHISGNKILAVEASRNILVLKSPDPAVGKRPSELEQNWDAIKIFNRKVDIVTVDEFSAAPEKERWDEVKSIISKSATDSSPSSSIPQWKFLQHANDVKGASKSIKDQFTRSRNHRQYSLDAIALEMNAERSDAELIAKGIEKLGLDSPPRINVQASSWNLHQFKTSTKRTNASGTKVSKLLRKDPIGGTPHFDNQINEEPSIALGGALQLSSAFIKKEIDLAKEAAADAVAQGFE